MRTHQITHKPVCTYIVLYVCMCVYYIYCMHTHTHGEHEVMISKMSQRQRGVMSAAVVLKTIDFLVEA